ncbi:hypothetical protein [Aeromonas media]|uniref:hypothetical protein n=1 Tax=Aeromonas media TaxID=651 RepID=UPI002B487F81|nr:hypothetical protein [Aeromonas media]
MTLTAAVPPSVTLPSKQDRLLSGLESSAEQNFARVVAQAYGFRVSNRWDRTVQNVKDDIQSTDPRYQNCTVDTLEKVVDRVIISANHHYSIYKLSLADSTQVRAALSGLIGQAINNNYAKTYPDLVDFDLYPTAIPDHYLCKVVDMDDGIACIFASVEKEAIRGYRAMSSTMITSQYFHTVFIPHNADRIEIRISDKTPSRFHDKHFVAINNAFIDILAQQGVRYTGILVNLFGCITSYFNDAGSGRIAYAILTTGQDSKDAELKNLKSNDYCARTQKVVDTKNNFSYECRAILLRKQCTQNSSDETEVSFFPHKGVWEANSCWSVQIKKPQTSIVLNSIISDVLARA